VNQRLSLTSLIVREYDEAITYFVDLLGFELRCDTHLSDTKRWVVVGPRGGRGAGLLLAKAATDEQIAAIGHQTGGRVFLFLETNDFQRDYVGYSTRGVRFVAGPRAEEYGTVAVFEDLYGNKWDLIGPPCEQEGAPHQP
jgi:catechol 2,3-dioxygenase-like lactoylglutathione lyase family enzyme